MMWKAVINEPDEGDFLGHFVEDDEGDIVADCIYPEGRAYLIAAAPDMLAALKAWLAYHEADIGADVEADVVLYRAALDLTYAALTKVAR